MIRATRWRHRLSLMESSGQISTSLTLSLSLGFGQGRTLSKVETALLLPLTKHTYNLFSRSSRQCLRWLKNRCAFSESGVSCAKRGTIAQRKVLSVFYNANCWLTSTCYVFLSFRSFGLILDHCKRHDLPGGMIAKLNTPSWRKKRFERAQPSS